ncbi:hypothetical protein OHC33_004114 [Knufia fluminis]|uniref:Uncharacterized protein n=1 Tax=Knufia fluminis TaxID=191047 RepID=A0AAN8I4Q4_9EURO|nr:hypothetical protein OHC33_004114 [Knufia fluminis]
MANPSHENYISNMIAVGGGNVNDGSYFKERDSSDDWLTTWGLGDDQSGGGPFNPGLVSKTHQITQANKTALQLQMPSPPA